MCFSATASFVASGVIGSIGVATLRHVREPRALLFAAIPTLFAVHQFTEGLVWLGLDGRVGPVALGHVTFLFMLYAQGILPFLMPLAVLLMEPSGGRRRAIMALTALGALVCAWMLYGLIFFPSQCFIEQHSIAYRNPLTGNFWVSLLYIAATCGALVASTWGNRGKRVGPGQLDMEGGGCSPIRWKYGLTTRCRAQASDGEQPWENISASTCR